MNGEQEVILNGSLNFLSVKVRRQQSAVYRVFDHFINSLSFSTVQMVLRPLLYNCDRFVNSLQTCDFALRPYHNSCVIITIDDVGLTQT